MNEPVIKRRNAGIAIVGMAGRFPGAATVKEFWHNLIKGVESVSFATDEQLTAAGVSPALLANPDFVRASSTVREPEFFDAAFFGFSAREAEIVDPQQRVFLECSWEALEDAAYDPARYPGAIGVFAGAGMNTYGVINLFSNPEVIESAGGYQVMVGNDKDFLCSRVAYKLNLRGPAVGVQTACSTSLVAVQMAFESLLRHECDMALAGGVSIALPQPMGYLYTPGMIFSRDGHCRAFDAAASGIVPGAGAGVAVLKRLDDALADGDHIYAVLRGAAINNDGSAKVGYSAPSVDGQAAVIRKSMGMAGFAPESIAYVEAHGTGTEVGDPIEIAALTKAFGTEAKGTCALGALKTNLGHLDAAAGIAGLMKTALSIEHRTIPPTLHFTQANPLIDFAETPFTVNASLMRYDRSQPFRAGVSSFGIGGTNAHVSLEEAPAVTSDPVDASQLIVLSAKSSGALERQAEQLAGYLEENPSANIADIAFTLQKGRQAFRHRRALVAPDAAQLRTALSSRAPSSGPQSQTGNAPADPADVVFLFPGQGSQYVNMGLDLYRTTALFRETVDRCCELLASHLGRDLREILYPAAGGEQEAGRLLAQTAITQPAVFVVEYAMAKLWMDLGVAPSAMVGHSVGEYVAACLAGVFSLEDGLALIAARGKMIQAVAPGSMLAVSLSEQDLEPLLTEEISVAAVNSPGQTVASGPDAAIAALEATLRGKKIECRRLRTSHAFHSPMMDGVVGQFVERVSQMELRPPQLRYLSNVTGTWITTAQATDPRYWGSHVRNAVRFADCARHLIRESDSILLEVGPGETLLSLMRAQLEPRSPRPLVASMRHPLKAQNDRDTWLAAVGRLWLLNVGLDWNGLYRGQRRLRLSLPTYPFERQRYWVEPKKSKPAAETPALTKRPDIADWFYAPSWKRSVAELLPQSTIEPTDTWLVFIEAGPLARALAEGLGEQVIQVRPAAKFRQVSPELVEIDPASREDYVRLLKEMEQSGRWPHRIVHAWMPRTTSQQDMEPALDRGILSVMFLLQATVERGADRQMELNIVNDRGYSVFGEKVSSPAPAALNAFCAVIAPEYPNVVCRIIDIDLAANAEAVPGQLLGEVLSAAANETVAYRGATRWVRGFDPVRLEKPDGAGQKGPRLSLQNGGTYLITGGLGGVGLVLAQHLARTVQARIVLTSRTPLPPAAEWNKLLAASDTARTTRQKLEAIRSIEAAGGKVLVLEADVADTPAMRRVLAATREQFGALHGIIHAAGVGDAGVIQDKARQQALSVLSPKVQGTEWMREIVGSGGLDFILLVSSISAVTPTFGLSIYGAANGYLDGFAAAFDNPSGTRVLSANWDTWREVGMAVDMSLPPALAKLQEERLKQGILSTEAEDVFDRLLRYPLRQIVISPRDFNQMERHTAAAIAAMRGALEPSAAGPARTVHARPASMEQVAAAGDEIEQFIVGVWEELLGIEPIGVNDNFFQLGGHSLLGTQVLARLRERFQVGLSLRVVFEAATPAELAQHIRVSSWATTSPADSSAAEREEIEI